MMRAVRGYALVITAAMLWATIGLFYRSLIGEYRLARETVVAYRAGLAALTLLIGLLLTRARLLYVRRRDWGFFALFGSVGVAGFYLAYILAISTGSVAQAAVLLYTAPFWIMLWAVLREGEQLGWRRLGALSLAFGGCVLVAGAYNLATLRGNAWSVVWGLLSGLGYAVYSLCSSMGTRRGYSVWTVVLYSLGPGAMLLFAVAPWSDTLRIAATPALWPPLLAVALLPTLLAPLCFTLGLAFVRASNASIIATLEPVIAALLAWLVLHEQLATPQILGMLAVIAAVLILVMRTDEERET